jgi:hypothetical protein
MKIIKSYNPWYWSLASLILLLLMISFATPVQAQPRALLQMGTPQGLNNQLGITRVPVLDASGGIKYYDITLVFSVDNAGKLTLNSTATKIVASPNVAVGAFSPGTYRGGPDGCDHVIGAPGIVGGGRISGSISTTNCNHYSNFDASWVTGPIAGHPNEAVLRAAGIAFQGYSWGIVGEAASSWTDIGWNAGDIIGVIQSGRQLVIHNFGNDNKEDRSAVFTLR